jgi:hypothetical protein
VSLRDLRDACRNRYVRSCFGWRSREANHAEALPLLVELLHH